MTRRTLLRTSLVVLLSACAPADDPAPIAAGARTRAALQAMEVSALDSPYNAAGDGTTNDRAAIQRAIDAVSAAGGGTVTLPGGHTFLTGDLWLKSNVTLHISANATLLQSPSRGDYTHDTGLGRAYSFQYVWDDYYYYNYPIIYGAEGVKNVKVTGGGTIRGCNTSGDDKTIFASPIGMWRVEGFEVSNVRIENAHGYNLSLHTCRDGLISNVVIDGHDPNHNDDGVSLEGCQNVRVTGCTITTNDDSIYVWTSYDDPRGRTWCKFQNTQPTKNIEIDHNTLYDGGTQGGYHGILIIGWGGQSPDPRHIEISGLNVHDNYIATPGNIAVIGPDPFFSTSTFPAGKDFTFKNNTLHAPSWGGGTSASLDPLVITNCDTDTDFKRSPSTFPNAGFEALGDLYWSTQGVAGAGNDSQGQDGSWYGYISNGYSAIFEGLYLTSGSYRFAAKVQSSGVSNRMFVASSNGSIVASLSFANTSWQSRTLDFTIPLDGNYRLGIDSGGATTGWGRIDSASVVPADSGSGEQTLLGDAAPTGSDHDARYELGLKFKTTKDGRITKVRLYKHAAESGDHTVTIWRSSDGSVVSGPHAWSVPSGPAGWQAYTLPAALPVSADVDYVLSVSNSSDQYYAHGTNLPKTTGDLVGVEGRYGESLGSLPDRNYQSQDYLRDVVFVAGGDGVTPPGPPSPLGYTAVGGSSDEIGPNYVNGAKYTASQALTADQLHVCLNNAVSGSLKLAIYSDNAGRPGSRLGETGARSGLGTGWQAFNLTEGVPIAAGSAYWLCTLTDGPHQLKGEAAGGDSFWLPRSYDSGFSSQLDPPGGMGSYRYSIYASRK